MTFSLCVHETKEDATGTSQEWYGVAVTTRLPGVGTMCPYANEQAAIATQSLSNPDLGRLGIEYAAAGLSITDALQSLLNADPSRESRQVHGVDSAGGFTFTGDSCKSWAGHLNGSNYTVAGNMLTGEEVLTATATAWEQGDRSDPLPKRLIEALAAGDAAGGDRRTELRVQSAAILVQTGEDFDREPPTHNLRIDASETPIADLRRTYDLALEGYQAAMERYGTAIRADSFDE